MSLRKITPCDHSGICPYNAEFNCDCEHWCGTNEPEYRYTIVYKGYLFDGDSIDDWNHHDSDSISECMDIYYAYPDIVSIEDNEYGVTFANGEWF